MNEAQHRSFTRTWLSVYKKELVLRRKFMKKSPKKFKQIFGMNPKGLSDNGCPGHVWVPATHLWIHDGAKGSIQLHGQTRRSFREAMPVKSEGKIIQPQICWRCIKARESIRDDISFKERLVQQSLRRREQKVVRPRGRKPRYTKSIDDVAVEDIWNEN